MRLKIGFSLALETTDIITHYGRETARGSLKIVASGRDCTGGEIRHRAKITLQIVSLEYDFGITRICAGGMKLRKYCGNFIVNSNRIYVGSSAEWNWSSSKAR